MRPSRRLFVLWSLCLLITPPARASVLKKICEHRLVNRVLWATGIRNLPVPDHVLGPEDKAEIARIVGSNYTPEERFDLLTRVWENARLSHINPVDRMIVHNRVHHMNTISLHGIRADDVLEDLVSRPGMEFTFMKVVDFIHDLERVILSLDFSNKVVLEYGVDQQRTERVTHINRVYQTLVLSHEWNFLHAVPRDALAAEEGYLGTLQLPWRGRVLAKRMLSRAQGELDGYRNVHRAFFGKFGFTPEWRLSENPFAQNEYEREMVDSLGRLWRKIDADVARASRQPGDHTKIVDELRQDALVEEWQLLHPYAPQTRRLALALVDVKGGLSTAYRERLRTAILHSDRDEAGYVKSVAKRLAEPKWAE